MKPLLICPANPSFAIAQTCQMLADNLNATTLRLADQHPFVLLRHASRHRTVIRHADVVHAFGGAALACAIAGGAHRVVYSPAGWPTAREIGYLRTATRYRAIDVVCDSESLRRTLLARGVPASRAHLVPPSAKLEPTPLARNDALRQRLGIAEDERILFAPGPLARGSGHANATWGVSVANVVDPRHRLVVHDIARAMPDGFRERLLDPSALIDAAAIAPDIAHDELFGVADALIITPTGPISPRVIAMAMASGKPIVATPTSQVRELLEDRRTALFVTPPSPHMLAERIADLFADEQLMRSLAEAARAEADEGFSEAKALKALHAVYELGAAGSMKML